MIDENFLHVLTKYFGFYEKYVNTTSFSWDPKAFRLGLTKNKFHLVNNYLAWICGTATCIYGAIRLAKELFIRDPSIKIFQIILYALFIVIVFLSSALTYAFVIKADQVATVLNTTIDWNLQLRDELWPTKSKKKEKTSFRVNLLQNLVPLTFVISLCASLLCLFSPVDPLQRFVVDHFPEVYHEYSSQVKLVVMPLIGIFGFTIWGPIILIMAMTFLYLEGEIFWFTVFNGANKSPEGKQARERLHGDADYATRVYNSSFILNIMANQTLAEIYFPITMATAGLITIFTNFATVALYNDIPKPGYFVMPMISIFVHLVLGFIIPQAASVHQESSSYIDMRRSDHKQSLYIRKSARGFRPNVIKFGNFFTIHRGVTFEYFAAITDFSITLILS